MRTKTGQLEGLEDGVCHEFVFAKPQPACRLGDVARLCGGHGPIALSSGGVTRPQLARRCIECRSEDRLFNGIAHQRAATPGCPPRRVQRKIASVSHTSNHQQPVIWAVLSPAQLVAPDPTGLAVFAAGTSLWNHRFDTAVVAFDVECRDKLAFRINCMGRSSLRNAPLERQQSQTAGGYPAVCIFLAIVDAPEGASTSVQDLPITVRNFATEGRLRCHWDCYVTPVR